MKFNFTGNKIRMITPTASFYSKNITIKIDGNIYSYTQYSSAQMFQMLTFDKQDLTNGEHFVEIISNDTMSDTIDAIDIDSTGQLKPYSEAVVNESITLDKSTMNLNEGDSGQLTATTTPVDMGVNWTSSDSSIATVDSTGKVTGVKEGTCTITATTTDGLTATCTVTVTKQSSSTNPNGNTGTTTGNSCGTNNSYGILNLNNPSGYTQNNNNGGDNNSSNNSNNNNNSGNSGNNYSNNNNSNSNNNYYYYINKTA